MLEGEIMNGATECDEDTEEKVDRTAGDEEAGELIGEVVGTVEVDGKSVVDEEGILLVEVEVGVVTIDEEVDEVVEVSVDDGTEEVLEEVLVEEEEEVEGMEEVELEVIEDVVLEETVEEVVEEIVEEVIVDEVVDEVVEVDDVEGGHEELKSV